MDFFDLHCDTLTTAMQNSSDLTEKHLHMHFPIDRKIKKHCQCFAVYCPDMIRGDDAFNYYTMTKHYFERELKTLPQYFEQVHSFADIDRIVSTGKTAAMLTVEGGAVLSGKIENLSTLCNDGVKMMTLTWNGANELGCGRACPEKGLTPFGFDVIREMERMGMVIDISHLSDAGVYDVFKTVSAPIAASHSNVRSVCGNMRNLTDEQFTEMVRRKGIVGINFYRYFLNDNGENASVHDIARHIEHMLDLGGEDIIAMGSDFDGCDLVCGIGGAESMPELYSILKSDGIAEDILEKIFWKNAYNFFQKMI